jgi:hypothetical protein
MKLLIDIPEQMYLNAKAGILCGNDILVKAIKNGTPLDKIRAEIEQAANNQFKIAMGVSDLNERYAHIQMENAYRHSLNVIDKYKAEGSEE